MRITGYSPLLAVGLCVAVAAFNYQGDASPGTGSSPHLLVANQVDRTLSIIDPATGTQIAAVPTGDAAGHAHEVAASPDGRVAYAPIYGDSGVAKPGTDGRNMMVIDIPSHKVVGDVDFGHGVRPHCPVYDPVSKLLYVTTELDKAISIIDPQTLKIVGTIPTGEPFSHMLVISHDGRRGYTSNVKPGTVSVLDIPGRKTITVIPISPDSQRIAISMDDKMVFTADQTKPQLAVVDTATNTLKTWVPLVAEGYGTGATLDGRWLLVTMPSADKVAVVDLKTLQVTQNIDVSKAPQEVLIGPGGREAYVSCMGAHQVAVIDLAQMKVKRLIEAGKGADGLAWAK